MAGTGEEGAAQGELQGLARASTLQYHCKAGDDSSPCRSVCKVFITQNMWRTDLMATSFDIQVLLDLHWCLRKHMVNCRSLSHTNTSWEPIRQFISYTRYKKHTHMHICAHTYEYIHVCVCLPVKASHCPNSQPNVSWMKAYSRPT